MGFLVTWLILHELFVMTWLILPCIFLVNQVTNNEDIQNNFKCHVLLFTEQVAKFFACVAVKLYYAMQILCVTISIYALKYV